ncbi:hypothetical protein [Novosphingobium humi]|uniref:Uncharacterized protein n=1 Tax=Novosphingobium humi TaxID=2282397 RepID=A0ABY7U7G2_9SPHN|nr:hypothetical protein [Novosphingobium humi]WCT80249.1 hypothetical protein PQ457_22145 [Novosphingobium humi]
MIKNRAARRLGLAALGSLALGTGMAHADTVNGSGSAAITKDVETVRNLAEAEAKRSIIREMLQRTLGERRMGEVTSAQIERFASQLRPDMITARSSSRVGTTFTVTLTADVDQAWFRAMLADAEIDSASRRADNNRQMILVYLDREDGTASDLSKPAEVEVSYDRRTGDSFSDHSVVTASSRENAASSSSRASASTSASASASSHNVSGAQHSQANGAYRESGTAAYGASGVNGSVAGKARSSSSGGYSGASSSNYSDQGSSAAMTKSASASSAKSASAYSASSKFSDRTNVDAETHDDVSFHSRVVYQQGPRTSDGDTAVIALSGSLLRYDVQVSNARMAMAEFFKGPPPRYSALKNDPRFNAFLSFVATRNSPYFLGGKLAITQTGTDGASGQAACSGVLEASANVSADGRMLGGNTYNAQALGSSPEECAGKLTSRLADQAASDMGPAIQNHWRRQASAQAGQVSTQLAGYVLVLRAPRLDMAMQADLMDALGSLPGVSNPAFVSSNATELQVNVTYAGAAPLQFALYQKLRDKPAFAGMQVSAEGRSVLLCIQECGIKR